MQSTRRPLPVLALILLALGALAGTDVVQAQNCQNLIVRSIQGGYEQSSLGFQPVQVYAHQQGHLRAYWRSNSPDPYTLSVQFGHPSAFGYQGQPATRVRQHFRMQPQNQQQVGRGKVDFQAAAPGTTTIGFRIIGSRNPQVFNTIPQGCRSGVLTVQVSGQQQQGNYGNQGYGNQGGYGQGSAPGAQIPSVAGRYNTDWGIMTLNQEGKRVWGTYPHNQGRVEGLYDGQVFRGVWRQGPSYKGPNDAGDFEIRFHQGGFSGAWSYGTKPPGQWDGNWNGRWLGR